MTTTSAAILCVILLLPLAAFAGLILWARWLQRRASAPRWLVLPPALLPAIVGALGAAFGLFRSAQAISGGNIEVSQKARMLAEGISEFMNSLAFSLALALLGALWLGGVTWRYRWSSRGKGGVRGIE